MIQQREEKKHTKLSSQCFSSPNLTFYFVFHIICSPFLPLILFTRSHLSTHTHTNSTLEYPITVKCTLHIVTDWWLLLFDCDVRKRSEFIPLIFISTSVVYITIDAHHLLLLLAKVFFLLHCFGS